MNTLRQGSTLQGGRYIIKKVLGQGGFGITYLAEHNLLRKQVAIKEFFMKDYCNRKESTSHVSVGTDGSVDLVNRFRQKFLSEARKIAHLQHANIIRISDVFEENGTAYYVMDYCEGGSLADLLKSYPMGIEEPLALKYVRQIASALRCVHEQEMNHLDVKPANIMLDAQGNAILIDFGISKNFGTIDPTTNVLPLGVSTGYAPIEQYSGISEFSPQTDIYSLGATLYKLLTGQTPPEPEYIDEKGLPRFLASNIIVNAVIAAMQYRRSDRPKNIDEWLRLFDVANMGQIATEDTLMGVLSEEEKRKREREKEFQRLAELSKLKETLNNDQKYPIVSEKKRQEKRQQPYNNYSYEKQGHRRGWWLVTSFLFVVLCGLIVIVLQKRNVIWGEGFAVEPDHDDVGVEDQVAEEAEVVEMGVAAVDSCSTGFDENELYHKISDYEELIALGDEFVRSLSGGQLYNSVNILLDAAERGYPAAQYRMGKCFEDGECVQSDVKKAKYWYEKAATQGDKLAQNCLARMYYWGKTFREDGLDKNIQEAIRWFEKSANQGYELSQYFLARIYFDGKDVPRDPLKAVEWFTKSANQGDAMSQYYLGFMYLDGIGIQKDPKMAYKWFRLSAAQGSSAGQIGLARCYHQGLGVERNMQEAFRLFKEASEQGQKFGTYMMGEFYEHGWVVEKNLEKAESLYKEAAEQGSVEAALALKFLNKQ